MFINKSFFKTDMETGKPGVQPKRDLVFLHYGDWFQDQRGELYIVPALSDCEVLGPHNGKRQSLEGFYRRGELEIKKVERKLGLTFVPKALRRFNRKSGYYAA